MSIVITKAEVDKLMSLLYNKGMERKEKKCPRCGVEGEQIKLGFTSANSQVYKCKRCDKRYTPIKKARGYSEQEKKKAL